MNAHFIIKAALHPETINEFISLSNNLPYDKEFSNYPDQENFDPIGYSKEKTLPDNIVEKVYNIIQEKVEQTTGKLYITQGVYNLSVTPLRDHVDATLESPDANLNPAYTIIIPLICNIECHTIVWDATASLDYNTFTNNENNYTPTLHEKKLLSHCSNKISGLGKPHFYKWTPGDIICMRRNYVHSSDNFTVNNNTATKQSIILITRYIK